MRITGVSALGCHGYLPVERTYHQPFVVDIEAEIDARPAGDRDELALTVSYADLAQDAISVIAGEPVNLIETLATRIAKKVLARGALSTTVTVHKPDAPVGVGFSDAAVTVHREGILKEAGTIRRAILALGANLGDVHASLDWAVKQIGQLAVNVVAVSDFVETQPVLAAGQTPQPSYLNGVVAIDTALAPLELLTQLQQIEVRGGRVRHERWGARYLDIDVIDIEGVASSFTALHVPHPSASKRLFVLEPWLEVDPQAELSGRPVSQIVAELKAAGEHI